MKKSVKKKGRKQNKKYIKGPCVKNYIITFVVFIFLFVISFFALGLKYPSSILVLETERTDVRKLPPEIKNRLDSTTPSTYHVPILTYHYIENVKDKKDTIRQSLNINPYIFEQQIITLKNAGYTFLTAKDLSFILDGKKKLPKKPVLITIDDGHWDLYTDVLPILKKYNVKVTAYIIPGFLNQSDFLTVSELQSLASSGFFEIGAHTVNHVWLKGKPISIVKKEVEDSKARLEVLTHKPVVSFAYPYGSFDEQTENVVKKAGFKIALSTVFGFDASTANRYFLYRVLPGGRTGENLLNYLE